MRLAFAVAGDQIVCTVASETLSHRVAQRWDGERVTQLQREVVKILTRGNRARKLSDANLAELRHVGEELYRLLVPPEVRELVRAGSGPLLLDLDEQLVAAPWELLFDGEGFWCRRYDLGRTVATRQPRRGSAARSAGTPIRILVISCDPRGDLPEVAAEGEAIAAELDKHTAVRARVLAAPRLEGLRRQLKDYDVVHFAGHADYVAGAPAEGGWHLVDGKLSSREIAELGGGRPMPLFVFSNACQSGHTEPWRADDPQAVYGLANAFLLAGVRHYLGTQWEVVDGQSATFAAALYAELVTGASIGSSVRRAREAVITGGGEGELAWASYVLYGDPAFAPLRRAEGRGAIPIPKAQQLDGRASAPWKRPRAADVEAERARATRGGLSRSPAPRRWLLPALIGAAVGVLGAATAMWLLLRR